MVHATNKDTTKFKADLRQRLSTAFTKLDAANSVQNIGRDEIKGASIISRSMQAVAMVPKVFGIEMPTKIVSKLANYGKESKFANRMGNLSKVSTVVGNREEFIGQLVDKVTVQYEGMREKGTLPKIEEKTMYRTASNALNGKGLANALTSPNYEKVDDVHPEAKLFSESMVTMLFDGSLLAELDKSGTGGQQPMSPAEVMVAMVSKNMAGPLGVDGKIDIPDVITGQEDVAPGLSGAGVPVADAVGSGVDAVGSGVDAVGSGTDAVGSGADTVESGTDTVGSVADAVGSGVDAVGSGADTVESGTDTVGSFADKVDSTADKVKSFADKVGSVDHRVRQSQSCAVAR
ncbi:MAG: hypothetical protein HON23_01175 [Rickettsiales bacterium]|nr:hypothetical protein [Rickettsiales bacterium]